MQHAANSGDTENSALLLKILTIGDTAVGKTCLIMRFSGEEFTQSFITTVGIGECFFFFNSSTFPPLLITHNF
jgi:GTPase SAR1 family protein